MGIAFHMSYGFIGSSWSYYYENKIPLEVVERYDFYWRILVATMLVEMIFASILYVILVLKGKSLFPKWMALCNPLFIILYVLPIIFALPAPIGGYVAPACLNLSTMVFVGLSIIVIRRNLIPMQSERT
ncbi:MAG: hypothetical protein K0S76_2116 [Herbinix sp.]|jgi:hypothetical protein|nr:hypothetical protein [Herbinix sp.]